MDGNKAATPTGAGPDKRRILAATLLRFAVAIPTLGALVFVPAGSLAYRNGWLFIATILALMAAALVFLFRKDPTLLEKRLKTREGQDRQKLLVSLSALAIVPVFVLPPLDWRFGWSRVPVWIVAAATLALAAGYALFIAVLRANSFASRVIEVQEGQKVIDSGPYAHVRHPMYSTAILIYFAIPLVLGSWWGLVPALAIPPLLALRARSEEAFLRKELPGYAEYAQRVRWRFLP
ncbi:MAG: isoprenylcysteine carboxylmethyltransferase family protein, partial [Spirochaetaceae bacterium]|nr:isoprenylcysteine carboxylmethyltransferase family protein [Spirochaetaceae bacterium]